VKLWDSVNGKELFSLKGHDGLVYSVSFSPDCLRLASGSKDKNVKLWDSVTGKELLTIKGHARDVNSVAFSPDGRRLASGSDDSTMKIWDSVSGKELLAIKGHFGNVNSVAFSPDGKRFAAGSNDTVTIWETIVPPEVQDRRAARQLVADLFARGAGAPAFWNGCERCRG
jgi:WD40 repeat protein